MYACTGVCITAYVYIIIRDVPIIDSQSVSAIIGHYFWYRYRLVLSDITDIVISVPTMSFITQVNALLIPKML